MKKVVVDLNGETHYIDMTPEEIADVQAIQAELEENSRKQAEAAQARATLKESARQKLIAGQPLTAEEASVLVV
jgi:hypothetical protein